MTDTTIEGGDDPFLTPNDLDPNGVVAQSLRNASRGYRQRLQAEKQQRALAFNVGNLDANPQQVGEAMQLSSRMGVPAPVVEGDLTGYRNQEVMAANAQIIKDNPILVRYIDENPQAARLAHKELPQLDGLGKTWQAFNALAVGVSNSVNETVLAGERLVGEGLGLVSSKASNWWHQNATQKSIDVKGILQKQKGEGFVNDFSYSTGNLLGTLTQILLTAPAQAPLLTAEAQSLGKFLINSTLHTTRAMALPATVAGVNTGYDVLEKGGSSWDVAKAQSAALATTILGGVVPLNAPGGLLTRLSTGAISGGASGAANRQIMNAALPDSMQSDATANDYLTDALMGALMGGVMGPRATRTRTDLAQIGKTLAATEQARVTGEQMQTLAEIAKTSDLRKYAPEDFKKFLSTSVEGGRLSNVYIGREDFINALHQSGDDLNDLVAKVPSIALQLRETAATKGDVAIPATDFITYLAPTKTGDALIEHLKIDPEGLSVAQSRKAFEELTPQMQKLAEGIEQARTTYSEWTKEADAIHDDLTQRMLAMGRHSPEVARASAAQLRASFEVMAARTGKTPKQVFEEFPLNFKATRGKPIGFGQLDEQQHPARPIRRATNLKEAGVLAARLTKTPLRNEETGFVAHLSNTNLRKMASAKAVEKSNSPLDHALAIANVDHLFKYALHDHSHVDKKGEPTIKKIHRFIAPMVNGEGVLRAVKLTVKETTGENEPNPLYSVESISVEKPVTEALGALPRLNRGIEDLVARDSTTTSHGFSERVLKKLDAVKRALEIEGAPLGTVPTPLKGNLKDESAQPTTAHALSLSELLKDAKRHDGSDWDKGRPFEGKEISATPINDGVNTHLLYQRNKATKANYESRIDELFNGGTANREGVRVLDKSDLLGLLGYDHVPVMLQESKVLKGRDTHPEITSEVWKKVPEWIDHPAAVFNSDTVSGRLVFIAPEDIGGKAVSIVLEPNAKIGNTLDAHLLLNAYTKDKAPFVRWIDAGHLRYVDKKEFPALVTRTAGLQLPGTALQNKQGTPKILTEKNLIGYLKEQNSLQQSLSNSPRGYYDPATHTIAALQNANLSTVLHESGHFYLHMLDHFADAPLVGKDFDLMLKHFGVKDRETWRAMSLDEQRPHHEAFARSFEAYLMEGKAPSVELQGVFARFRAWLLHTYKKLEALNVTLTDEVRGVFDRLLATEAQIHAAEHARGYALLPDDLAGKLMSPDKWAEYKTLGAQATDIAVSQLQSRSLRDMQWLSGATSKALSQMQKRAEGLRLAMRGEAEQELANDPTYRAIGEMSKEGGLKLNPNEVPDSLLSRLIAQGVIGDERDMHPDAVAELTGFNSGAEILRKITEAPDKAHALEALTDSKMLEKHGEFSSPEAITRMAEEAIHSDVRARVIATEMQAAQKAIGPRSLLVKTAKEIADSHVATQTIESLDPRKYLVMEARAARLAETALRKDDIAQYGEQKRIQLLNNQMAKASQEALRDAEKGLKYLKRFEKESVTKKLPGSFVEQIAGLLDKYDLRKYPSGVNRAKERLIVWAQGLREAGYEPYIADWLLEHETGQHYATLSIAAFRELVGTVKSLEHTGKETQTVRRNGERVEVRAVVDGLLDEMAQKPEKMTKKQLVQRSGGVASNILGKLRAIDADLTPVEFKFNRFDRHNLAGPFRTQLFEPMVAAAYRKVDLWKTYTDKMAAIGDSLGKEWQDSLKEKINGKGDHTINLLENTTLRDPRLAREGEQAPLMQITRAGLLGIMRHMGNEFNFDKLVKGYGWDAGEVWKFVLNNARKEDWIATQAHWDSFEPLWAESEKTIRALGGVPPEKIPARAFMTPHGEMRGGYAPIDYDPVASKLAQRKGDYDLSANDELSGNGVRFSATTTRNKSMIARNHAYTDFVNLDIRSSEARIRDTIHDLAYREALLDASKILDEPRFREKFQLTYGAEEYAGLKKWLSNIRDMYLVDGDDRRLRNFLGYTRVGMVTTAIGYRVTTVFKHGSSAALKSLGYLAGGGGATYFAVRAGRMFSGHMRSEIALAKEKFPEIRARALQMDRDYKQGARSMYEKESLLQKNERMGHWMVASLDLFSAVPTAWAAYDLAITKGIPVNMGGTGKPLSEAEAIKYADSMVRQAHGSALEAVRSNFMNTRNDFKKAFGVIYGFMNNTYGQIRDITDKAGTDGYRKDILTARTLAAIVLSGFVVKSLSSGLPEKEEIPLWLLEGSLEEMAGSVPGVRDIFRAITTASARGIDEMEVPTLSPIVDTLKTGYDIWREMHGQKTRLIQDAFNMTGAWTHISGLGQIGKSLEYVRKVNDGRQNPEHAGQAILGALLGPPPKKH